MWCFRLVLGVFFLFSQGILGSYEGFDSLSDEEKKVLIQGVFPEEGDIQWSIEMGEGQEFPEDVSCHIVLKSLNFYPNEQWGVFQNKLVVGKFDWEVIVSIYFLSGELYKSLNCKHFSGNLEGLTAIDFQQMIHYWAALPNHSLENDFQFTVHNNA